MYRHLLCTGAAGCQIGIVICHIAPTDEGRKCHAEFTAPNAFGVTACLRHRNTLSCHEALCHVTDTDCHFVTILTLFFFVTNVNLVTILTHGVAGPASLPTMYRLSPVREYRWTHGVNTLHASKYAPYRLRDLRRLYTLRTRLYYAGAVYIPHKQYRSSHSHSTFLTSFMDGAIIY